MTSVNHVTSHMEGAIYGMASLAATAVEVGRARAAALDEAVRQDRQDARTLDVVADVARAMTRDRLALRQAHAEAAALREELAQMRSRALRAEAALVRAARSAA